MLFWFECSGRKDDGTAMVLFCYLWFGCCSNDGRIRPGGYCFGEASSRCPFIAQSVIGHLLISVFLRFLVYKIISYIFCGSWMQLLNWLV
ncbi:hypothetical protein HanIR_Chr07g0327251 [Helianthus annuus]|nr:hypothetical protein HanIR_Chr07g0327251 [Helianthus annuus]